MTTSQQRPNKRNVRLNDFLVVSVDDESKRIDLLRVTQVRDGIISAENGGRLSNRKYADSLVLKQDGTYLIGKNFYLPRYISR